MDAMTNPVCVFVLCAGSNLLLVLCDWMYGCISQRVWGMRTVNVLLK